MIEDTITLYNQRTIKCTTYDLPTTQ